MRRSWISRWQLPLFFVLAYGITWAAQIPAFGYAAEHGHSLTNEANLLHLGDLVSGDLDAGLAPYLLVYLFAFGPTVAGIVVTAAVYGRTGLTDLYHRCTKVRIPPGWVLVAVALPVVLTALALGLAYLVGGLRPIGFSPLVPLSLVVPLLAFMLIFTGLAEEVGWRGYALPELQRRHTAERASWILGIAWGLWHLPVNLVPPYLRGELSLTLAIPVLIALTVGIVGWTIVLTWFYNNTGSVFWVIVIHGWFNTWQSYLILSSDSQLAPVLYVVVPWVLAVVLLRRYGPQTLTRPPGGRSAVVRTA